MSINGSDDKPQKYGEAHREAKKKRLKRVGYQCEITGEKRNIESHHVQPKSLDVGTDCNLEFESNHQELVSWFHRWVHKITNVSPESQPLFNRRQVYAKKVWNNPHDEQMMESLRDADEVLMQEFIDNMMNNLTLKYRDKLLNATLVSFMSTNRDIKIEIRKRELEIEALQNKVDELQNIVAGQVNHHKAKIIDITQYHAKEE